MGRVSRKLLRRCWGQNFEPSVFRVAFSSDDAAQARCDTVCICNMHPPAVDSGFGVEIRQAVKLGEICNYLHGRLCFLSPSTDFLLEIDAVYPAVQKKPGTQAT